MSRNQDGVRPWKTQRHLPEDQVTTWEIDSQGELDEEGRPLPRRRKQVKGSKAKATAVRRSWLNSLALEPIVKPKAPKPPPTPPGQTLAEIIEGPYSERFREQQRETTVYVRMNYLRAHILPLLGKMSLAEVNTPDGVSKLKAHLAGCKLAVSTRNQILICLSSVLTWAAKPGLHTGGPLIEKKTLIEYFPDNTPRPGQTLYRRDGMFAGQARHKRISDELARELLAACEDAKERVLVGLGLFCGCRISETGARSWADVNWDAKCIHISTSVCPHSKQIQPTKNGMGGDVGLNEQMEEYLRDLKKVSKCQYLLGPDAGGRQAPARGAMNWRFQEIVKRTGKKIGFHRLRHTFCCRLADAGLSPPEIQMLARHQSIETTYGYLEPNRNVMQRAAQLLAL